MRAAGTVELDCVIAIDVGGSTLKGAAFAQDGSILARHTMPTFAVRGDAADGVRALLRTLLDEGGCQARGVGVACPGMVDSRNGVVRQAVNLGWTHWPLTASLREEFGLPVALEHDARAAALGERAASGHEDFAFVPIGTGVSAAIVSDGRLLPGATGAAGEFGHVPVVPDGRACACGQRGCVEAYASGTSILARYRELGGDLGSVAEIAAASAASDELARRVWEDAIDALAAGIAGLVATVDPAAIVVGGGVARAGALLLDPLAEWLKARLTWRDAPELIPSALGPSAGLIGAGILGWGTTEVAPDFAATALAALDGRGRRADRHHRLA